MSSSEATSGDEVVVSERKVYGAVSPTGENIPLAPRADIRVLLVHGIGNHREGVTLRAFGQPLLDWLKQWLRGVSGDHARGGDVTVKLVSTTPLRRRMRSPRLRAQKGRSLEKRRKSHGFFARDGGEPRYNRPPRCSSYAGCGNVVHC
jgi:hypothetical protein